MSEPLCVLLVEDSEDDAMLVTHALRRDGYELSFERVDTPQAMTTALARQAWDVVIADFSMPHFSGLEALKLLRSKESDLPFIIVSGTIGEELAVKVMKAGANDYVMKGSLTRLAPAIRRELQEAKGRRARRRAEEQLERRHREIGTLYEIGHDISATLDLPTVLRRIATHARDLLEADDSEVYLVEPDGQTLRAIIALGDCAEQVKATAMRLGEGFVGYVAQSGEAEIINDVAHDARAMHIPGTPDQGHALMCVPLISKDQVIGVMALARLGERDPFADDDLYFLVALARQAAIAITNARLFAQEEQRATELARTLEKQKDLERLKDELIQNVSHELRTPLGLILGYAEMLHGSELGELDPLQQQSVAVIARRARILRKMIDDFTVILEVRNRELERKPVDLGALIRNLLADFQALVEQAGLTLEAQVASDLPLVSGNEMHLERVLDNLLDNARKFTSAGSVSVRLEQERGDLVLEVSDTGVGIPRDEFERIFDLFYQVDGGPSRHFGGTGLGLALVKEVVEFHGGAVVVESQPKKGSTFKINLPCNGER